MIRSALTSSFFLCVCFAAFGADEAGSLSEALLQNEVTLPVETEIPWHRPVLVVTSVREEGSRRVVNRELLEKVIGQKLSNSGFKHRRYEGDFQKDFAGRRLSIEALLTEKLIVEVDVRREADGYSVSCSLSLVEYRARANRKGHFQAHRTWHSRRDIGGLPGAEVDDAVVQYIQSGLGPLRRQHLESRENRRKRGAVDVTLSGTGNNAGAHTELTYRLHWNDPDNRRGSLFVGATFGTPALLNATVGYWGSRSVPLVAGLSGMYFTRERRGIQAELGWAFDNEGTVKQALSAVGAFFNGTREVVGYERDIYDRVVRTTIDTINELHPYAGPAYTIRWNDFRLQGGAAFRLDSSNEPTVRVLISIGFTPAVRF